MTRYEFLGKLKEALILELDEQAVNEHVTYYSSYISEAVNQGRSEAEVLEELGDPWAIARSLISMEETSASGRTVFDSYDTVKDKNESKYEEKQQAKGVSFSTNSRWKTILFVLGIIGVIVLVLTVIGGIISLLTPILVPVIIITLVFRLINRRR
jgi:uncharacterized membrane protein